MPSTLYYAHMEMKINYGPVVFVKIIPTIEMIPIIFWQSDSLNPKYIARVFSQKYSPPLG